MSNKQGNYNRRQWNSVDGTGRVSSTAGEIVSRIRPRGRSIGAWVRRRMQRRQGSNPRRWD